MSNFPVKCFIVALIIVSGNTLFAQTSSSSNPNSERENNPYSKYGIGEFWNGNNTALKGMGNITSAYQDPFTINSDNPASYSGLVLTTFEGGLIASHRTVNAASGESYSTGTASLGYINIGVPVGKHAGLSLGLRPFTKTYYALVDTISTPIGRTVRSYAGDGGLSYAYLGGAYKYKGLSLGFNLGYMFGNYRKFTTVAVIYDTIQKAYDANFERYINIGGLYWKGGVQYEHKFLDTDYVFRVGGTLTLGQNLNERVNEYQIAIHNFGDTIANDTVYNSGEVKGKLKMPVSYSIGIMLARGDKWAFGIDYTATNWSKFNSSADTSMNYGIASQSYKIAMGGEFTPNSADLTSYFSRVTYRFGLYYGTEYVKLQNTTLPDFGVTLGGSFPYKRNTRSHSRISTSLNIGRTGTLTNGLLQQTYVRFGFGLTFNEKWFIPRKYE